MSRVGVLALLAIFLVAQALAAEPEAKADAAGAGEAGAGEAGAGEAEADNPYGRSSHFNMEMYRLATVGIFLVVALVLGVIVYKSCSWPRLE